MEPPASLTGYDFKVAVVALAVTTEAHVIGVAARASPNLGIGPHQAGG